MPQTINKKCSMPRPPPLPQQRGKNIEKCPLGAGLQDLLKAASGAETQNLLAL